MTLAVVAIFAGGIVALLLAGVMREIVILRGSVYALSNLIVSPPEPWYIGHQLPDELAPLLLREEDYWILFISEGCGSCSGLIDDIRRRVVSGDEVMPIVIVLDRLGKPSLREMADEVARQVVVDSGGVLAKAASITAFPVGVRINDGVPSDFRLGPSAALMIRDVSPERLSSQRLP